MHMPVMRTMNPISCKYSNFCQPMAIDTPQMTSVRIESKTILVVADISLVTEIPAKLKKAIDIWGQSEINCTLSWFHVILKNTYHSSTKCCGKQWVMSQLIQPIIGILNNTPWIVMLAKWVRNEVKWNQKGGQSQKSKCTLPSYCLKSRYVVFSNKFFFIDHLRSHDDFKEKSTFNYRRLFDYWLFD